MCCIWNVLDLHLQQIFENPGVGKQTLDDGHFLYIMDRVGIFVGIVQKWTYNRAKLKGVFIKQVFL